MENDLRWLPTKEASAFFGVSSQFLKKDITAVMGVTFAVK